MTPDVIDILTAYLVRCYPQLKSLAPLAPIVLVIEKALISVRIGVDEILAWSIQLNNLAHTSTLQKQDLRESELAKNQAAVIDELILLYKRLAAQVREIECKLEGGSVEQGGKRPVSEQDTHQDVSQGKAKKQRKQSKTNLSGMWYEWFTSEPRLWSGTGAEDRIRKSDAKAVVAVIRLYFDDGYALHPLAQDYRDRDHEPACARR